MSKSKVFTTVQPFRLSGKEYTLLPSKDFGRMAEELARYQAEMASDLAVARHRLKDRKDKPVKDGVDRPVSRGK